LAEVDATDQCGSANVAKKCAVSVSLCTEILDIDGIIVETPEIVTYSFAPSLTRAFVT